MSITLNSLDFENLFDEYDIIVIKNIMNTEITAREKWQHEDFRPVYEKAKLKLLENQKRTCFYCQKRLHYITNEDWHIDHIVSIDEDARHVFTEFNLILSCKWCNRRKNSKPVIVKKLTGAVYSTSAANYRIIHPRYDKYSDHIDILADTLYTGITAKGRYTKDVCNLERFHLAFVTGLSSENRSFVNGAMRLIFSDNPLINCFCLTTL